MRTYGDVSSIYVIMIIIHMAMMRYIVVYISWYVTNIITMPCIIVYDNGGVNIIQHVYDVRIRYVTM